MKEKMKATTSPVRCYVSKYALTRGILEVREAAADAEKRRQRKILGLRKQLARLEALSFEAAVKGR